MSMGFSRQEYWTGLPFPFSGDLPDPRIEPRSPVAPELTGAFFFLSTEPPEKPGHVLFYLSFALLPPSSSLSLSISKDTTSSSFFFFLLLEMAIFQMFNRFVKIIPAGGIHPIGVHRGQYTSREQDHKLSLASPRCASLGRARSHNFLLIPSSTASAPGPAQRHSISKKAPLTRGSFIHSRGGAGWNPGVKL